jgi:hypothetical protein
MPLTQPQLNDLVALLSESLRAAAGRVIDDFVIAERARNAAALLDVTYEMSPRPEHAAAPEPKKGRGP